MKTKHTAIPWKYWANVGPTKTVLLEKDGSTIAELSKSVRDHRLEANTAFIVEACNNYDRLKAINAEMLEALKAWRKWYCEDATIINRDYAYRKTMEAINKAEGL